MRAPLRAGPGHAGVLDAHFFPQQDHLLPALVAMPVVRRIAGDARLDSFLRRHEQSDRRQVEGRLWYTGAHTDLPPIIVEGHSFGCPSPARGTPSRNASTTGRVGIPSCPPGRVAFSDAAAAANRIRPATSSRRARAEA